MNSVHRANDTGDNSEVKIKRMHACQGVNENTSETSNVPHVSR